MNLLNLNITRTRGRAAKPVAAAEIRELIPADLAMLGTERGITAPVIKKLRDSHHALARALATGCTPAQAQIITGYSGSRISILQADPAFKELVSHYRGLETDLHADMVGRMKNLGLDCVAELQDRLDEEPEEFSPAFLLEVAKTMADRTGAGPKTQQTNVNVSVGYADLIRGARERAQAINDAPLSAQASVIEGSFLELPTSPPGVGKEEPGA